MVLFYQSQLADFRSYEGQDMYAGEKLVPIKVFTVTKVICDHSLVCLNLHHYTNIYLFLPIFFEDRSTSEQYSHKGSVFVGKM